MQWPVNDSVLRNTVMLMLESGGVWIWAVAGSVRTCDEEFQSSWYLFCLFNLSLHLFHLILSLCIFYLFIYLFFYLSAHLSSPACFSLGIFRFPYSRTVVSFSLLALIIWVSPNQRWIVEALSLSSLSSGMWKFTHKYMRMFVQISSSEQTLFLVSLIGIVLVSILILSDADLLYTVHLHFRAICVFLTSALSLYDDHWLMCVHIYSDEEFQICCFVCVQSSGFFTAL